MPAIAHTPYKQWAVYRKKHLLIGCHRHVPETYDLAKAIVGQLEENLSAANARVARAPAPTRLASLMSTDQLQVAVLRPAIATEMAAGVGEFQAYGKIPLRLLLPINDYVLVGHAQLLDHHCWQITQALESMSNAQQFALASVLPWHRGSHQYVKGLPMPTHD